MIQIEEIVNIEKEITKIIEEKIIEPEKEIVFIGILVYPEVSLFNCFTNLENDSDIINILEKVVRKKKGIN